MNTDGRNGYSPPSSRQLSIWLPNDLIDYVAEVGAERGVPRNRAFVQIVAEHRKAAERKLARAQR